MIYHTKVNINFNWNTYDSSSELILTVKFVFIKSIPNWPWSEKHFSRGKAFKAAILSISYLTNSELSKQKPFFILSRFRVLSRRDKERAKIAHSKDDDLAFHAHIKSFVSSSKFFNKLEENEHARHFYLESSVVKVIFNH